MQLPLKQILVPPCRLTLQCHFCILDRLGVLLHLLLSGTYPDLQFDSGVRGDAENLSNGKQEQLKNEAANEGEGREASFGKYKSWSEFNEISQANRLRTHDTLAKRRTEERKPRLRDIFSVEDEGTLGLKDSEVAPRRRVPSRCKGIQGNEVVKFSGKEWDGVSDGARMCLLSMLKINPAKRASAEQVLRHPWVLVSPNEADQDPKR